MRKFRLLIDFGTLKKGTGSFIKYQDSSGIIRYAFSDNSTELIFDSQISYAIEQGVIEEIPEVPELREWTDEDVKRVIVLSGRYCKDPSNYDYLLKNYKRSEGIK